MTGKLGEISAILTARTNSGWICKLVSFSVMMSHSTAREIEVDPKSGLQMQLLTLKKSTLYQDEPVWFECLLEFSREYKHCGHLLLSSRLSLMRLCLLWSGERTSVWPLVDSVVNSATFLFLILCNNPLLTLARPPNHQQRTWTFWPDWSWPADCPSCNLLYLLDHFVLGFSNYLRILCESCPSRCSFLLKESEI